MSKSSANAVGGMRVAARVESLGFAAIGKAPGLRGLAGSVDGDADGFAFAFDPKATLRFDWPRGFGVPHEVKLHGRVAGWREGDGWRVGTAALRIDGEDYGADVRGGLWFQGDGTRPRIDLAAETRRHSGDRREEILDPSLDAARRRCAGSTRRWSPGTSKTGARSCPAISTTGRSATTTACFQADGAHRRHGAEIPAGLAGHRPARCRRRFVGSGFTVAGSAALAGVAIPRFKAASPSSARPSCWCARTSAATRRRCWRCCGRARCRSSTATAMTNLTASGPATATFALDLPLGRNAPPPKIAGDVELRGAKSGRLGVEAGFRATCAESCITTVAASTRTTSPRVQDGQPGQLSLRAGAAMSAIHAGLRGRARRPRCRRRPARSRAAAGLAEALRRRTFAMDHRGLDSGCGRQDDQAGGEPAATALDAGRHDARPAGAARQARCVAAGDHDRDRDCRWARATSIVAFGDRLALRARTTGVADRRARRARQHARDRGAAGIGPGRDRTHRPARRDRLGRH